VLTSATCRAGYRGARPGPRLSLKAFRRGYEEWDIEALLGLYADDVELIQIDRDNPPSSPRVRHGKEVFRGMFEHCAAAGVKATVENPVAGEDRARPLEGVSPGAWTWAPGLPPISRLADRVLVDHDDARQPGKPA
jgi:hypothetical protein